MCKNESFDIAVASLFKGMVLPCVFDMLTEIPSHVEELQVKAIRRGVYIPEDIIPFMSSNVYDAILSKFGYDVEELNQGALHKSFGTVLNSSEEKLAIQQILHYMSVFLQTDSEFSTEAVDSSLVYIPSEELNLPKSDPLRFTVIRKMTKEEVISRTKNMVNSNFALQDETQQHLLAIIKKYEKEFSFDEIKNKELRVRVSDVLGIMPKKASEFLRYLVYKKTGKAVILHTKTAINNIIYSSWNSEQAFVNYIEQYGVESIAKEFNRHKKFWVSFKKDGKFVARTINRARKLSTTINKPHKIPVLDRIGDKSVTLEEVVKELKKVSLSKKVSVINSLLRRITNPSVNMFVIRNGRTFVQENSASTFFLTEKRKAILDALTKSIVEDIRPNVEGKRIFIPEYMDYAFPVSEKMFVGNIPFFSTMKLPKEVVFGVHWFNVNAGTPKEERVDLDLHYVSENGRHLGWDSYFYDRSNIIFSGDMTNAPLPSGATEAMYVSKNIEDDFACVYLNQYTYTNNKVNYSFFIGEAGEDVITREYLIDAHKTMLNINGMKTDGRESSIGFLESTPDGKRFHFMKSITGNTSVARSSVLSNQLIEAMKSSLYSRLALKDVLAMAGAVFEKGEEDWDIDLSLEHLTSDSFLFLMKK